MSTGESPSFSELPPRQPADAPAPVSGGAYDAALDWRRTPTILLRRPATLRRRLPLRWVLTGLLLVVAAGTIVEATTRVGRHPAAELAQPPAPREVSTQTTPAVAPTAAVTTTPRQSKPALLGPASTTAAQTPKPARRPKTVQAGRPELPLTAPVRPAAPVVPAKPVPAPAVVPQQTTPATPALKGVTPTPDGGYVLEDGLFRVSGDGRQVLDFALRTHCGGSVILPPMQVDATGAFAFDGHPPGTPAGAVVQITGRFVSSRAARGTWKVSRYVCRGRPVSFIAQLS